MRYANVLVVPRNSPLPATQSDFRQAAVQMSRALNTTYTNGTAVTPVFGSKMGNCNNLQCDLSFTITSPETSGSGMDYGWIGFVNGDYDLLVQDDFNPVATYAIPFTYSAAPTLSSSVPADNATLVAAGSTIALTFSEAVTPVTGNVKIVNDTNSSTETIDVAAPGGKFAWSNSNKTLTITPGTALAVGKSYHVEVDATAFKNTNNVVFAGIANATTLNFATVVPGACGTAAGQASSVLPAANLCSVGSASVVASTAGQYSWSCTGDVGTSAAVCTASWSNTGGTGQGNVSAPTPQSNNLWNLGNVSFAAPSGSLPANAAFLPFGVTNLQLNGGTLGSTATVTINYTADVPAGAVYMKFGKSPEGYNCTGAACLVDHWYQMPTAQAVFAQDRRSVTLSIQDGGVGDNDMTPNQVIVDPGGPVVLSSSAVSIPTLSEWGMILMSGLLALTAFVSLRRRADRAL
jgi:methionine-rich copper-binding protein CopC